MIQLSVVTYDVTLFSYGADSVTGISIVTDALMG